MGGGIAKLICMSNVRNFSEIAPNIAFPEFNFYELYYSTFEKSELGRIKKLLPLREMAENFGLVRKSMRPKLGRRLLDLLGKRLKEIRDIERGNGNAENLLTVREKSDLKIITRMYRQQKNHFRNNDSRESIPNRIVSLSKPHLRPIVRGKEVKRVEFGAKVNNILVDGISFIEKLSFNAFNEVGVEAKKVGGDTGYAGTENRDYCKANGIQTSFVKRGRPFGEKKKEKDLVRKEFARVRVTAVEGSFGTQKEHYALRRVKARTKRTEILYIFFGIHTANVVQLADRTEQRARLAAA